MVAGFNMIAFICDAHFFFLLANVLRNVHITPEYPRVLVGDTLVLNCSGVTTYNGRIRFDWKFQQSHVSSLIFRNEFYYLVFRLQKNVYKSFGFVFQITRAHEFQNTMEDPSKKMTMTKALILHNITMEDQGTYTCTGTLDDSKHDSVKVTVYGKCIQTTTLKKICT